MQRKLVFIIGGVFLIICCGLIILFLDGYYLPFKACRPIAYPDGRVITEEFSHTTSDSLNTVLSFYDQHLDARPWQEAGTNQWGKKELDKSRYLYVCYGVDINHLSTETGCIYINGEGKGSYIKTVLFRSEGGNIQCPR